MTIIPIMTMRGLLLLLVLLLALVSLKHPSRSRYDLVAVNERTHLYHQPNMMTFNQTCWLQPNMLAHLSKHDDVQLVPTSPFLPTEPSQLLRKCKSAIAPPHEYDTALAAITTHDDMHIKNMVR
jgi:hypothetical protein